MWRLAKEHDFYTAGDYLEFRYGPRCARLATALVGIGVAGAARRPADRRRHDPQRHHRRAALGGALIGGAIMTIYFTAGGLLGSAWVNTVQLVVMLAGSRGAAVSRSAPVGGLRALAGPAAPAWFGDITLFGRPGSAGRCWR